MARSLGDIFTKFEDVPEGALWGRWDGGLASGLPTCAWQVWANAPSGAENPDREPWKVHSIEAKQLDTASTVTSAELTGASRLLRHLGETFLQVHPAAKRQYDMNDVCEHHMMVEDSYVGCNDAQKRARTTRFLGSLTEGGWGTHSQ